MSFEVCFTDPWLDGVAQPNPQAPQFMEVTIAGRAYVLDTSFEPYRRDAFRHRSIQSQRESISLDNIPGEGTVNTEGLWRRIAEDWHFGAGQPYQDRKDSLDTRFSTSKGIDPWMQWQLSLLNDTQEATYLGIPGLVPPGDGRVVQVGDLTYVLNLQGDGVRFSSDLTTWHGVTAGTQPSGIATDGYNVWISDSTDVGSPGLYHTTAGSTTASVLVTNGGFGGVWYVGDRLMTTQGGNVFNIIATTPSAAPAALWTHPNTNWYWSAMCSGSSQIYLSGYVGGSRHPSQSTIYRTTIEPTGTALTIPVQALPMEAGEYVTALYGYLNFVFVGSNLGLRMCRTISAFDPTGNEGDLEAGPLVPGLFPPGPVNSPVYSIMGHNRFVYFGWSNYDSTSTGLGRCDLSTFIDTQSPAFTSDLMVTGQGAITSMDWCTINEEPIFVVAGKGVYTGSPTPVPSGEVTSGYLGYGIPDDKIVLAGQISTIQPESGSASMALASDSSSNVFVTVGTQSETDPNATVFAIGPTRGNLFSVKLTLTRDEDGFAGPTLHRWMVKAIPAVTAGTTVSVVLRMWNVQDIYGQDYPFDPYVEKAFLENLRTTQTVFAYTEGPLTYPYCTVDEVDWLPEKRRDAIAEGGFQGNLIVYIKTYDLGA